MRKPILSALLSFVALCIASCAQPRIAQTTRPDESKFVEIAIISTEVGVRARQTLQNAGIKCVIEAGSADALSLSGVWVSRSGKLRAISLLKADPVVQKCMPFVWPNPALGGPGIVFDIQTNRPESGIPREARQQEKFDLHRHGTLAHVLGDTLQAVTICHFNTNVWTEQKQVGEYLTGLLVDQQTETWTFQIWSQGVGEPDIECLLTFKNHRQGKLLVWGTTACVRDDTGKWWFVSVFDYYHRKDPRETRASLTKHQKRNEPSA